MSTDNLNNLFEDLKADFDVEEPNSDHKKRFFNKLNHNENVVTTTETKSRSLWKPLLGIAASILLIVSLFLTNNKQEQTRDLASVSPEMAQTQDFFTVTIQNELKKLDNERSPLTDIIINDALKQIKILEKNYNKLKTDLTESGKDQRVIYAMISNFQSRIDILTTVLEQIEDVKQLKTNTNQTSI